MRRTVITRFAVVSFLALSALVVACAKSDDPDLLLGPAVDTDKTEPAEAGSAKLPPKTQKPSKPKPLALPEAGPPADAGAPPDEEEPEETGTDCPAGDIMYTIKALTSTLPCPNGGSDCQVGECCVVNMFSADANKCVTE